MQSDEMNELGRNGWHTIERNACNECHGIEWMDCDALEWSRMESAEMEATYKADMSDKDWQSNVLWTE